MNHRFRDPITDKIAAFLVEIGIPVSQGPVAAGSFLPGVAVASGGLVVDEAGLLYPGDLLHEAGHLAFAPSAIRATLSGEIVIPGVNADVVEVQAICWSYAASIFLDIAPEIVFHENGYRGRSASILLSFGMGVYVGLPGLEAAGMAFGPAEAARREIEPFPAMQKWLLD